MHDAHVHEMQCKCGSQTPEVLQPLPRLPTNVKGKVTKKLATKKRKYADADTERAAAVTAAAKLAERGGARSGVQIVDQLSPAQRVAIEQVERRCGSSAGTIMLEGRRVALEETQP